MKVLQLSKFFPPVHGGIESVAWELAEGLHAAGLQHAVLCANQGPTTLHDHAVQGYEVTRAGSLGTVLSTSVAPALLGQLRRMSRHVDVLHVHMPDPAAALAIWAVRPAARLVLHWHSDVIRQQRALRLYAPLQRWLLQRADAVVATSEPYAHASEALHPWLHKVHVIPIGISDNHAVVRRDRVAVLRQQVRGRKVIFALGRMTYYKGFDVLIQAASALPDDVVVLVGGGGELLDGFRHQVAQAGLAGKVQFLGHVPDEDLPDHFAACDVFCMPSTVRAEAYGVAMLEAMVMARPIVASDIPGSAVPWVNVHGSTGFNVAVADPQRLAQALTTLCNDAGLCQTMGQASRARYLDQFTADLMTQRTIRLYQRLCGRT